MARKLKTYQTSLGFFDLAIAAPSMKAALQAWGSKSNQAVLRRGCARKTVSDLELSPSFTMRSGGIPKYAVAERLPAGGTRTAVPRPAPYIASSV
jgi:colicin import membrane protein